MSSNLTHYSNYTTLLRMYPLHYLCCEVEVEFLSPFSLHTERDHPHHVPQMFLVILVFLVYFTIVTSIVVSFLLNVVRSIRFRTRIRGRLVLFSYFTLSNTPFPHLITHTTKNLVFILACLTHGVYSGKRLNSVSVRSMEQVLPLLHLWTCVKFQI